MTKPSAGSNRSPEIDIAAAIAGDRPALQRLLLRHHRRLHAHVARRLPQPADALITVDDIVQETYIDATRAIRSFVASDGDSFFPWLRSIAEHRLLDALKAQRAAKRGGGHGAKPAERGSIIALLEAVVTREKSPRSLIAGREAVTAVQVAMATLTSDQRQAVQMRFLDEKSVDEVAAALGRTPGAIHMLLQRALKSLRKALEIAHN
jgi:RNA polymerase sigma-70 factor (ECF subfamily)